jgi:uncharacterized membrane protein
MTTPTCRSPLLSKEGICFVKNMKKIIIGLALLFAVNIQVVQAAENLEVDAPSSNIAKTEYNQAKVVEIAPVKLDTDPNVPVLIQSFQRVKVEFTQGSEKGEVHEAIYYPKSGDERQKLKVGERVYVMKVSADGYSDYSVSDRYRIEAIWWLLAIFVALILITVRAKGIGSMLGLLFSFAVIMKLIVPWIMSGANPVIACATGALIIAVVSIYLAHGFNLRTSVSVIATVLIIMIAALIDYLVVNALHLYGTGTEEAVYAQFGESGNINLRGLLLGGILIGVLGVLDDITTAQVAVVDELKKANSNFKFKDLYQRSMSVGKEHIASLINTLVLAYVGASFPLVLLFQQYNQPLLYIINSELVAEEIGRTIVGSIVLIIAVPITTALAAWIIVKRGKALSKDEHHHGHHH